MTEWISCTGQGMPVRRGTLIYCRNRSGREYGPLPAGKYIRNNLDSQAIWFNHDQDYPHEKDIVAYRIAKENATPISEIVSKRQWQKWFADSEWPVPPFCRVDVIHRDGSPLYNQRVIELEWSHKNGPRDILAYRTCDPII